MKLFTKDLDKKLFDQYQKGNDLENQMVVGKIFNPYGRGTWYLLNSDPADPDYIWAIVDLFDIETGSVSRSELETLRVPPFGLHLERDMYFTPVNAAELLRGLQSGKQYEKGGEMEYDNKVMLLNLIETMEHHIHELEEAVEKKDKIESWVLAKAQRAVTDIQDITHYTDSKNEIKREEKEGEEEEYEKGGEIKWQDAQIGDSALVVSENKMGMIVKDYGRKFHLKFLRDGTEKTYDASELRFFGDVDDFDLGGEIGLKKGQIVRLKNPLEDEDPNQLYEIIEEYIEEYPDANDRILVMALNTGMNIAPTMRIEKKELEVVGNNSDEMADGGMFDFSSPKVTYEDKLKFLDYILSKKGKFSSRDWSKEDIKKVKEAIKEAEEFAKSDRDNKNKFNQIVPELYKKLYWYYQTSWAKLTKQYSWDNKGVDVTLLMQEEKTKELGGYMAKGGFVIGGFSDYKKALVKLAKQEGDREKFAASVKNSELKPFIPVFFQRVRKEILGVSDADWRKYTSNPIVYQKELESVNLESVYDKIATEKMAEGGIVVTSIKDIPDFKKMLDEGKITYRGLGMGKLANDFYKKAGTSGYRIKVSGKEYFITDEEFDTFSRDSDGKLRVRFAAPKRKYAEGGNVNGYEYKIVLYCPSLGYDHTDRYSIKAKSAEEAKDIAYAKWQKEYPDYAEETVEILTEKEWENKPYNKIKSKMAEGGEVKFKDKVASIKAKLLKNKKVPKAVQKDYGKTFTPAEAEDSAKRIVGAMTAKERLQMRMKSKKKK